MDPDDEDRDEVSPSPHIPHIDEPASNRGRCCHRGRHEMRAALISLATLEIAVGGGGAALAGLQLVGVHAEAHGATGLAPFEAGGLEDFIEAFSFRLRLDEA